MKFIYKIHKYLIFFFSSKKIWKYPKKSNILIYGDPPNNKLFKLLKNHSYEVLYLRGEKIYFKILLLSLIYFKNFQYNYKKKYIEYVDPKVIITFLDNDLFVYNIKQIFNNRKIIVIQNGWRAYYGDLFESLENNRSKVNKNLTVDYLFTFGECVGNYYDQYIKSKKFYIGSFLSNSLDIKNEIKNNYLTYISQWQKEGLIFNNLYYSSNDVFKDVDIKILNSLNLFCKKNSLELCILLRSRNNSLIAEEKNYYRSIIKSKINFLIPDSKNSAYNIVDYSKIIVGVDSTLAYESLSRGNKTAFFSIRGTILKLKGLDFAWPCKVNKSGSFWTNSVNDDKFLKILNFLFNIDENNWLLLLRKLNIKKIISNDPNNHLVKKIINKCIE